VNNIERGGQLIEVPDAEYDTMACNVLAVAPGQCLMLGVSTGGIRTQIPAGNGTGDYTSPE